MSNLLNELEQAKSELNSENQRGALADAAKLAELKAKIEKLTEQLEKTEEAQRQTILNTVDEMKINSIPLRELFSNTTPEMAESAYQIVSVAWKQSLLEEAEKGKKAYAEIFAQLTEEKEARTKLQAHYDELYEQTLKLKTDFSLLTQERDDALAKRDSAVRQLEEAKEEIARLNSQIDDLRKEIAVGAANAPKVIDISASMEAWKAAKEAAEASRPAVYDVQPLDMKQSRFSAKVAETGEEIEFNYLEKGKYREVTAEEAEVFRAEYAAKRAQESAQVDAGEGVELTPPPMQFQDEEDATTDRVDENNSGLEVAGATVTRAEFEALKARVAVLEGKNVEGGEAA